MWYWFVTSSKCVQSNPTSSVWFACPLSDRCGHLDMQFHNLCTCWKNVLLYPWSPRTKALCTSVYDSKRAHTQCYYHFSICYQHQHESAKKQILSYLHTRRLYRRVYGCDMVEPQLFVRPLQVSLQRIVKMAVMNVAQRRPSSIPLVLLLVSALLMFPEHGKPGAIFTVCPSRLLLFSTTCIRIYHGRW